MYFDENNASHASAADLEKLISLDKEQIFQAFSRLESDGFGTLKGSGPSAIFTVNGLVKQGRKKYLPFIGD
ncbi:hypothetical protein [Dyadobacter sandarakinus]|uniref:Uncharacterized protein n=1 Tax=Dyadobacter sandarakinus TaxID=2747268 RepID=A0ABX7I5K4_9BACT|nr:hypothetical protein [Dyadobacter sandarakinus]QRR00817.1 hypothetical protein HWI92_07795 [Dyadobacter sandarakinus]